MRLNGIIASEELNHVFHFLCRIAKDIRAIRIGRGNLTFENIKLCTLYD